MAGSKFKETARRQGTTFLVTSTGTSVQSATMTSAVGAATGYAVALLLSAKQDLTFKIDANPTAALTGDGGTFLSAGTGVVFIADPLDRIAVISETGTATLNVTRLD
jgi:1-aminocyclopropane-1-carboxylate deaminase/D-cysteine desulfhydrase-like pyridoxal-dependent ACC family enzyme